MGAAQRTHQERNVHGGFQALARDVANHHQHAVRTRGFQVKEIAAHFVGRAVNGVDLEAGCGDLFLGNQELLHAARGGQLGGGVLLVPINAHETEINDEENDEDSGEVADRRNVNGNRPGIDGERRPVDGSSVFADRGSDDRLDDSDDAEDERNEPQARFEVASDGSGKKSDENKDEPSQHPYGAEKQDADEQNGDGGAVADKKQCGSEGKQERRGVTEPARVPGARKGKKDDQKLEEEIGRDEDQLEDERGIPECVEACGAPGQLDKAEGSLGELMQGQPEIFRAVSLREVEREQEDGKYGKQNAVNEARQALEERAIRPQVQLACQVAGVAEVESAIGEESGVRAVADCDVVNTHHEGKRGFIGRHVEVIDARDQLIVLRRVAVRAFGLNV